MFTYRLFIIFNYFTSDTAIKYVIFTNNLFNLLGQMLECRMNEKSICFGC